MHAEFVGGEFFYTKKSAEGEPHQVRPLELGRMAHGRGENGAQMQGRQPPVGSQLCLRRGGVNKIQILKNSGEKKLARKKKKKKKKTKK
jgi:hypothetical protein